MMDYEGQYPISWIIFEGDQVIKETEKIGQDYSRAGADMYKRYW